MNVPKTQWQTVPTVTVCAAFAMLIIWSLAGGGLFGALSAHVMDVARFVGIALCAIGVWHSLLKRRSSRDLTDEDVEKLTSEIEQHYRAGGKKEGGI